MERIKKIFIKIRDIFKITFIGYKRVTTILWKKQKKLLLFSYTYSFVNSITPIINAFIYGYIVNFVIEGVTKHINIETPLIILFLVWFLVSYISQYINSFYLIIWQRIQLFMNKEYLELFLDKLNSVDIKTFQNKKFQEQFNKAEDKYDYIGNVTATNSFRFNSALLSFIFSIIAFIYFSPLVTILILFAFIPSIIYEINYFNMSWGIWNESSEYRSKFFALLNIFRSRNAQELKIHNSGNYLKDNVKNLNDEKYNKEYTLSNKRSKFNILGSLIDTIVYISTALYIFYKALNKLIPIGSVVTYLSILGNYISSVTFLSSSFVDLYSNSIYLDDIHKYLDFEIEDKIINGKIKIKKNIGHKIEFKNVYFKYPQTNKYIFKDLTLTINPKEKIAIVGENGSGKSTFINLLCRFYDVDKGEILIDGINVKDIDINSWYEVIGVLFQDFINYKFSVKEDIFLGRINEKSDKNIYKVIESSKKAGAHKFINKLNKKYETALHEKDIGFSGGQWQKLALAREFFRDPDIIILDEPTSNLDPKSEDEIFRTIEKSEKDKNIILISHRYSTVRNVDKIFIFEKGKILEEGTYKELMKNKSKYYQLFTLQAKGYK